MNMTDNEELFEGFTYWFRCVWHDYETGKSKKPEFMVASWSTFKALVDGCIATLTLRDGFTQEEVPRTLIERLLGAPKKYQLVPYTFRIHPLDRLLQKKKAEFLQQRIVMVDGALVPFFIDNSLEFGTYELFNMEEKQNVQ